MNNDDPNRLDWMDDEQWRCAQVAAEWKYGFHHLSNLKRCGPGIKIDELGGDIATFDFNEMTRLVVLAHDRCVRAAISKEEREENFEGNFFTQTYLIVTFHPRSRDGDRMGQRHPDLESHIGEIRKLMENTDGK